MKCLELTIIAQAPLAIGRQKPGSVSEVEHFIPGAVIRGAIAGKLLHLTGQQQTDLSQAGGDFQTLFLDEQAAIFQNAYPAIATISPSEAKYAREPIYVLPATAVSSKTNPGFKQSGQAEKSGVFDTLVDRFCAEQCGHLYDPSCPVDQSRVEPFGGFYSKSEDSSVEHHYRSHAVSTRFLTRVGINRRRATAQDEILYSTEVLNESFLPNTKGKFPRWEYVGYRGYIYVLDDAIADKLQAFINHHSERFRLGGGASRGLGKVKVNSSAAKPERPIQQRIEEFNKALKQRWQQWSSLFLETDLSSIRDRTFFTLNLQSDAILSHGWRRTTVITPEMLNADVSHLDLELHAAYTSYDYRGGWNAAWGLMKDVELITSKGSVYLFSTAEKEKWITVLEDLEQKGVGDRTVEGFGQIQVCNEFHTVFRENAK